MKQYNPFPAVSSTYGAPMGRRGDRGISMKDCLLAIFIGAVLACLALSYFDVLI